MAGIGGGSRPTLARRIATLFASDPEPDFWPVVRPHWDDPLRDALAREAMGALIRNHPGYTPGAIASLAYAHADAMLVARRDSLEP